MNDNILILSDLHFGSFIDPKFSDLRELRKGIEDCLSKKNLIPEFILCAGDLTSKGKSDEFKHSLEFLNDLASIYSIDTSNILALVGNHDVDWAIRDILKNESYPDLLSKFLSTHVQANFHWPNFDVIGPGYGTGIKSRSGYQIIALNSSWNCIDDSRKHGELGEKQLEWFRSLKHSRYCDVPSIVALHHHPEPIHFPRPIKDLSQVIEGQELLNCCCELNVQLVVHGHRHHPALVKFISKQDCKTTIPILCLGSLSVAAKDRPHDLPNFFHFLEFNPNTEVSHLHTFNSTPRGDWDNKFNPDFHEIIFPLRGIPGGLFTDIDEESTFREFESFYNDGIALKYQTLPPQLKCKSPTELSELLKRYGSMNNKNIFGELNSEDGIMILDF